MPKATPSKADLPKKAAQPREVKDAALYAQRKQQRWSWAAATTCS